MSVRSAFNVGRAVRFGSLIAALVEEQTPRRSGGTRMELAESIIRSFWSILVEAGWWLLLGFGVAGLLHAFVPAAWLKKHLGRPGAGSVAKATLIGVPMPLCSCSVIPTAASLRQAGASKGASASFAVSTPEIDVPAAGLTWAMLGPIMAIARIVGAAASAVTAGLLIDATDPDRRAVRTEPQIADAKPRTVSLLEQPEPEATSCCHAGDASASREPLPRRLLGAIRYGYVDLPADLAAWLIIGLLASAVVEVAVPEGVLGGSALTGPLAILAAMGFGLVVYVCATGSTPLAAALVAKGLDPGAALAFLLAGPATNPATMAWVLKDMGRRALAVYLFSIGGVAFVAGLLFQWLAAEAIASVDLPGHQHGSAATLGGALLAALLTYAAVKPRLDRLLTPGASGSSCCATGAAECGCATDNAGQDAPTNRVS
ncbi:MAG: SO_0444 family Cu/Zn efflux transporter [Planctomycetota bacterium]